jgi:L-xylulokinase
MGKYLLSVDNGLTATKAVLFQIDGRQIESSLEKTPVVNHGDFSEIDMDQQWLKTAKCIRDVIKKADINPSEIAAVGGTGHGAGLYLLNHENQPLGMAITSMDSRSSYLVKQWQDENVSAYDMTLHPVWAGQAIPILRWLKLHEADRYSRISKILSVKDWIKFRLTGRITNEYTDASNSGLVNLRTRSYDKEILNIYGIQEMYDKLADLSGSCEIIGYVTNEAAAQTGLAEGTPVTAGLFDVVSCALGSGIYDDSRYSMIAGTWNINSGIEKDIVHCDSNTKCSLYADGTNYIYVESSATSAVNLEWFVDNMIGGIGNTHTDKGNLYKKIDEGVEKIKPEESNVIYLPFVHDSYLAEGVNAGFSGIRAEHNIFHVLRSVFEGVAFAHRMHIDNLKKGGIIRDSAVLSGGASNSDIWCQIFADILNIEVLTTESSQAGALGTAANAAAAIGLYRDLEDSVKNMVKIARTYYPGENSDTYQLKYKAFKELIEKLQAKN